VGYRPRTGTIFFTRNGKKLEDVAHGLKSQNFFPTVGANGPCTVHVNFGQMGFVFIEANVKKWGLAPMTGSLAPPPPYGSEQGSILLEAGRDGANASQWVDSGHSRSRGGVTRIGHPPSPGPQRSPTDISLSHLAHITSNEDPGEGASSVGREESVAIDAGPSEGQQPPEYTSPEGSERSIEEGDGEGEREGESARVVGKGDPSPPPIPTYDAAVGNTPDFESDDTHEH
jgi:hypothetical protein